MALSKSIETQFGVAAMYWKISAVVEVFTDNTMKVMLAGYATQQTRLAGAKPLEGREVSIQGEAYVAEANRAALYAKIKEAPEWADAEDC